MFDGPARGPRKPRKKPLKSFRSLTHLRPLRRRGEIPSFRRRELIDEWFRACGTLCGECAVPMLRQKPGQDMQLPMTATIDHINARGLGGTNAFSNLRVICHACNNAKAHEENRTYERRKKMYRERALKAARTRARNKARAQASEISRIAERTYHKAKRRGVTEEEALARAAQTRRQLEALAA